MGMVKSGITKVLNLIPGVDIGSESEQPALAAQPEAPVTMPEVASLPGFAVTAETGQEIAPLLLPPMAMEPVSAVGEVQAQGSVETLPPMQAPLPVEPVRTEAPLLPAPAPLFPMAQTQETFVEPVVDVESLQVEIPYRQESMASEVPTGGITNQIRSSQR